jgi:recombinational DNA repair protein (RecF pathway)
MSDNETLNEIVLCDKISTFERKILEGITKLKKCSNVVEIVRASFGENYDIDPILYKKFIEMFELSIKNLIANEKIKICSEFKGKEGKVNIYTRFYQIKQ